MSALFISHSSKDNTLANQIRTELEGKSYHSFFLDFDPEVGIVAGTSWERTLYRKLKGCQAVIAVCTDNYLSSQWCFAEIALARMERKPIFVLLVDPLAHQANIPAFLRELQMIDLRNNEREGYERLWKGLKVAGIDAAANRTWNPDNPPFPGLFAYQEKDAPVFFGREAEIIEAVDLLRSARRENLLFILGASGSGKSSVLRAGIIPQLRRHPEEWVIVGPFRPGQEPLEEMSACFAEVFGDSWHDIRKEILATKDLNKSVRSLRRNSRHREATVLLIIDQFEELLGYSSEHPANQFLKIIRSVLTAEESQLLVIATMRSDFLGVFQQHPSLSSISFDKLSIGAMPIEKVRRVIEEPARLAQIEFEAGLTDRLLKDTLTPDALPLLSFTLRMLWDKRSADGLLQIREYEALGGLQGAIAKEADSVLAKTLRHTTEDKIRSLFLRMVRIGDDGTYMRHIVRWEQLPAGADEMLKHFIDNRLLISPGDGTVGVVHEALFRTWRRLVEWLDQARADLLFFQEIQKAAETWEHDGYSNDDLWRGSRLSRATELSKSGRIMFYPLEEWFLEESNKTETSQFEALKQKVAYTTIRAAALRDYVYPQLEKRKKELEESIKEQEERVRKEASFIRMSSDAAAMRTELNTVTNFISGKSRWHPKEAEYVRCLGAEADYIDLHQFPCCGCYVTGDEGKSRISQFRGDGCQEPPEDV